MAKVFQKDVSYSITAGSLQRISRYQQTYFLAFIIALIICWSPSKLLGYLVPWICVVWMLALTLSQRTLRNLIFLLMLWFCGAVVYWLLTPGFVVSSALLSLMTYGPFFFVCMIPTKFLANQRLMKRMVDILLWVVLFQGLWGITQGIVSALRTGTFDGAAGDAVAGTIRPFIVTPDLSNPIFAINIVMALIILLPSLVLRKRGKLAFFVGLFALILASVVHVLLFLVIAFTLAFFIYFPTYFFRRNGLLVLFSFFLAGILAANILSHNFSTFKNFARYTIDGQTPRAQVVKRIFTTIPEEYPWMPLIGLGPGQFSSRAGLIGSGMYFGTPVNPKPLPYLTPNVSEPFEKYVLDLWLSLFFDKDGNNVHTMDNTSSTVKPYFSWLSIYSEFGVVGILGIMSLSIWLLWRARKYAKGMEKKITAVSFATGVIFFLLLGFQENYWEVSQAIFLGLMLLKVQYSILIYK